MRCLLSCLLSERYSEVTPPPSAFGTGRRGTVLVRNSVDGSYSLSGVGSPHGQHTRMRSIHTTPSDDDISTAPERRLVSHFSIGSSIASSHGKYASPDRYVTYDDPCEFSHLSINFVYIDHILPLIPQFTFPLNHPRQELPPQALVHHLFSQAYRSPLPPNDRPFLAYTVPLLVKLARTGLFYLMVHLIL